jgi:hypothetical protein
MLALKDWVVPRLFGVAYMDKPPLFYWLTAVAYRSGVAEHPQREKPPQQHARRSCDAWEEPRAELVDSDRLEIEAARGKNRRGGKTKCSLAKR